MATQAGNPIPVQQFGSMTQPQGIMWNQPHQYNADGTLANTGTLPNTGGTPQPGTTPGSNGSGAMNPGMPNSIGGLYGGANDPTNPYGAGISDINAYLPQHSVGPISVDPNILNSLQQYQQAAYANQTSRLDPQWAQQQAAFDQQMQSRGFAPGSQGYNAAYQNFMQGRNDAYSQAYNNSFQTGLNAQNQAFNQSALPVELENQMRISIANGGAQEAAAGIAANASMQNNAANNATNQLLGLGNLGLGYGAQQMQGNQQDFQNLMAMMGYGTSLGQYNNGLVGNAQQMMLGGVPNSNPYQVDVTGAYGLNQQGNAMNYNAQVQNANGQNQMMGQLGSAALMAMMMFSSRTLKDDHGPVDKEDILDAMCSIPVHKWNYKNDATPHIGTFAEDFNAALGLPDKLHINVVDAIGALTASVQQLHKRIEQLEKR